VKFALLGSALTNVFIDASLALFALVVSFVSALWYVKVIQGAKGGEDSECSNCRAREEQINDA